MKNEPDPATVDRAAMARVLAALDDGAEESVAAVAAATGLPERTVERLLERVAAYRDGVARERSAEPGPLPTRVGGDRIAPGTVVGDFVVDGVLGRGAMGVVYRARQRSLGDREVALKVLPGHLIERDPRFVERFRREASLAATIHHPHLAEVYGLVDAAGTLCFAMRLVEGCTLQQVLARLAERFPDASRATSAAHVRACVVLAQRIASALATVHDRGLVHRDVKPSNVMLEGVAAGDDAALHAAPVLVDFGLLRPTGDTELTGTRTMLGTPAYASHEVQLGRDVDERADVFSLGALLHDLLAVTSPGARAPATSGMAPVDSINPAVDERLAAIVEMALQERRELRYRTGGELREELDRYLRGEPVRARPVGAWQRWRLWTRRNPAGATKALGLGAVVLAVAIALVLAVARVVDTTAIAGAARGFERDGDLVRASEQFERIEGRWLATSLPWLREAATRAAVYADGRERAFGRAVRHLRAADRVLAGRDDGDAEFEMRRAHDRLCDVLYDPQQAALHAVVREHLWRGVREAVLGEGSDVELPREMELRLRIGLGTWANYLLVDPGPQIRPDGLERALLSVIDRERSATDRRTRRAAVSAYGTIRSVDVLAKLVEWILDDDEEVARIALASARSVYTRIHCATRARGGDIRDVVGGELMRNWVVHAAHSPVRTDRGYKLRKPSDAPFLPPGHAWICAFYEGGIDERAPTACASIERPLGLSPRLRRRIELARENMIRWLAIGHDPNDPSADAACSGSLFEYRQASGRTCVRHEAGIWQPRPDGTPTEHCWPADPTAVAGRVDFQFPAGVLPAVSGTITSVAWSSAEHKVGASNLRDSHLHMNQPGDSRLRVTTVVPDRAICLVVSLKHLIGTREELCDRGKVWFRLRFADGTFVRGGRAPGGAGDPYDLNVGADLTNINTDRILIGYPHIKGRRRIEIVLEYLHGNTTYWVRSLDLQWQVDGR